MSDVSRLRWPLFLSGLLSIGLLHHLIFATHGTDSPVSSSLPSPVLGEESRDHSALGSAGSSSPFSASASVSVSGSVSKSRKVFRRCSWDVRDDIQGVWIPTPNAPGNQTYVCSDHISFNNHWFCWDKPWSKPDSPNGAPSALQSVKTLYDVFDSTRAPDEIACEVDRMPTRDELSAMVRNRTIVLIGDSLNEQLFTLMRCELRALYGMQIRAHEFFVPLHDLSLDNDEDEFLRSFENYSCYEYVTVNNSPAAAQNQCLSSNHWCEIVDELNFRLCYAYSSHEYMASAGKATYGIVKRLPLGPRDIAIVNDGVHHLQARKTFAYIQNRTRDFLKAVTRLREERGSDLPFIMWRETAAQHFNTESGGGEHPPISAEPDARCVFLTHPNRSRMGIEAIERAGIPIMRTWNASVQRPQDHVEHFTIFFDCTHFCLPSATLRWWSRLVWHHVRTFVSG